MGLEREIMQKFGNRVRLRVCGICYENDQILMVKHSGLSIKGYLWAPPGGGVEFGSSIAINLIREFKEETGLEVEVEQFLFINEFLSPPLQAIELFFKVKRKSGSLKTGLDPEMGSKSQIIEEVKFFGKEELKKEQGPQIHSAFLGNKHPSQILNLKGYFKFENNYIK